MTDELPHRLSELVDVSTPDNLPPFAQVTQRRNGRRARRRGVVASAAAVVLVAGTVAATSLLTGNQDAKDPSPATPTVASTSAGSPTATPSGTTIPDEPPKWNEDNPPPVVLHLDGSPERLRLSSYCYFAPPPNQGRCVDGAPREPFVDVGSRTVVPFAFPVEGWKFWATFTPVGENRCERYVSVEAAKTGKYTFEVPLAGPPGDYQVDLFGSGQQGSVSTTFRWRTPEKGTIPPPTSYFGVVGGDKKELAFYRPELSLQDIADLSERPSAVVTVTAANGESLTLPRLLADPSCFSEGNVWFRGPESATSGVGELGPPPYRYAVDLVLDGTHYRGSGVWPRDEQRGNEPYVTLEFSPPLPGYTG